MRLKKLPTNRPSFKDNSKVKIATVNSSHIVVVYLNMRVFRDFAGRKC